MAKISRNVFLTQTPKSNEIISQARYVVPLLSTRRRLCVECSKSDRIAAFFFCAIRYCLDRQSFAAEHENPGSTAIPTNLVATNSERRRDRLPASRSHLGCNLNCNVWPADDLIARNAN